VTTVLLVLAKNKHPGNPRGKRKEIMSDQSFQTLCTWTTLYL